ncbi:hypothetical protein [Peribacillus sp. SCS-37]|uniref:hypothetical protein n=1 Tax=Paraperibacillus esterisolvens TaxID=3115296 RepID=UPI0039063837
MLEIFTTVGEHQVHISCKSKNLVKEIHENFFRVPGVALEADMTIWIEDGYGIPFQDYDVTITKEESEIVFRRSDYLISASRDYRQAKIAVHDELALKHALLTLYSSFIVHHNWGLLIHSSCVIEGGKAHIFAGQSGAGKSTAAKLSYPRELLSDEATLVKVSAGEIKVFDSPFRSEQKRSGDKEPVPLHSIQLLYQALQNRRVMIKKSEALLELMDKVFYWRHEAEETQKIWGLLMQVISRTPAYRLHFQKNNTFWGLIS